MSDSGEGDVSDDQISRQIEAMNDQYSPSQISFYLKDTTRTANNAWFEMQSNSQEEDDAKRSLHQEDGSALNIYTCGNAARLLGWATLPDAASASSYSDGVVIHFGTLPGGSLAPYNLGMTLVHEVGHWLGLFHTFQGGCGDIGDGIADTPSESSPAYGCPIGRDSCSSPGHDPVTNFMDYSDDSCMTHFTELQTRRMIASWDEYRNGNSRNTADESAP